MGTVFWSPGFAYLWAGGGWGGPVIFAIDLGRGGTVHGFILIMVSCFIIKAVFRRGSIGSIRVFIMNTIFCRGLFLLSLTALLALEIGVGV